MKAIRSRWWLPFWFLWSAGFAVFDLKAHILWAAIVMAVECVLLAALTLGIRRKNREGR